MDILLRAQILDLVESVGAIVRELTDLEEEFNETVVSRRYEIQSKVSDDNELKHQILDLIENQGATMTKLLALASTLSENIVILVTDILDNKK